MGYYIQGPNFGKKNYIIKNHGGEEIPQPANFSEVPAGKALVCVVHNFNFEAAGHAFSAQEFDAMVNDGTGRKKEWLLMDAALVERLTSGQEY